MSDDTDITLIDKDFENALKDKGTFIDITAEQLMELYKVALKHAKIRNEESVLIKEIMTKDLITVTPETDIIDAAKLLLAHNISGFPVVNESKKLVGVVTEADFLAAMGLPSHQPTSSVWDTLGSFFTHHITIKGITGKIKDIMYKKVVTISENHTLQNAIESMKNHKIKRLIVTDDENNIKGMVTRSNIVRVFLQ